MKFIFKGFTPQILIGQRKVKFIHNLVVAPQSMSASTHNNPKVNKVSSAA